MANFKRLTKGYLIKNMVNRNSKKVEESLPLEPLNDGNLYTKSDKTKKVENSCKGCKRTLEEWHLEQKIRGVEIRIAKLQKYLQKLKGGQENENF